MQEEVPLDPGLKSIAEVAQDLGYSQHCVQQLIETGELHARKATPSELVALRRTGRIRSSTKSGVWLLQAEDVFRYTQLQMTEAAETSSHAEHTDSRSLVRHRTQSTARHAPHRNVTQTPIWKVPNTFAPLIGREQEITTIGALLLRSDTRLLTLLGMGGIGKTRLSLEVARRWGHLFPDGVCFVSLAAIHDPELVVPAIARELGIPETGRQFLLEQVHVSLRTRHLLLILDNFEQVLDAAPRIEDLCGSCRSLKIVVTSRAVLHVQTEQQFPIPPLALPNLHALSPSESLSDTAAVTLFVRRVQAIWPGFQVCADNARVIAEICVRLDGLPLAIELAAARMKLLSPQALLARLNQRLQILTSVSRSSPARQQTLRNTLAWSYDLLEPEEQALFRQMSVFVGGCSLEAIQAVAYADVPYRQDAPSFLDMVTSLLDKSLLFPIQQTGNEPRFLMLETVREYGLECLRECGETERSRRAHALYYLQLAEQAEPHLRDAQQLVWLDRLEMEQENLRAALEWLLKHDAEQALRLGAALWQFWYLCGYRSEGRDWLTAVLALLPQTQHTTRAKALRGAGVLTLYAYPRDLATAHALLKEGAMLYRELGESRGLAASLNDLGWSWFWQNDFVTARRYFQESIDLAREVHAASVLAFALHSYSTVCTAQSNFEEAFPRAEESVKLCQELGDIHGLIAALVALSRIVLFQGNMAQAEALAQESISLARQSHNKLDINHALDMLACVMEYQEDYEQAEVLMQEDLSLARELGDKMAIVVASGSLGNYALYRGDYVRATSLVEETLALATELGFQHNSALAHYTLGEVKRLQGVVVQAEAHFREGLRLAQEVGSRYAIGCNLIGLAKLAAATGRFDRAAYLFGASASWLNPMQDREVEPWLRQDYQRVVEGVCVHLGEQKYKAAWELGQMVTPELVLTQQPLDDGVASLVPKLPPEPLLRYPDGLTSREVEVLRLVALGWSDARVAEHLVISPRTVNGHLRSVYNKINVNSRTAATRYAIEHALIHEQQ